MHFIEGNLVSMLAPSRSPILRHLRCLKNNGSAQPSYRDVFDIRFSKIEWWEKDEQNVCGECFDMCVYGFFLSWLGSRMAYGLNVYFY